MAERRLLSSLVVLALMLCTSGLALALRPTERIVDVEPALDLHAAIPAHFADWREEPQSLAQIVDPRQKEVIDRLYTQTLSRTYTDSQGYQVMLSIAYGEDQRDAVQLHYPEVCYPAQGFQVISNRRGELSLRGNVIPVRRLETVFGEQRREPVTYWTTIGKRTVLGSLQKKIAEMKFGLRGQIPDGLLFRVSSIDPETRHAFDMQQRFIEDLVANLDPELRRRLAGLP
jgi:EpsI family protein